MYILDEGGCVDTVFMDFMKVFDKVPHRRLLKKLKGYRVTRNVLTWIDDFLSETEGIQGNEECSDLDR